MFDLNLFLYLGILVFLYTMSCIVFILITDCDFCLAYAEKFGTPIESLKDKVIWITGASTGIGKWLAIECASVGAKVVLSGRREALLNTVRKDLIELFKAKPENVYVLPFDILDTMIHSQKFDEVIKHFGHLDILVNNAGQSQHATWDDIDLVVDKQVFDLNVFSIVSLSRIAVKYFRKRGYGHIAVTSSFAGLFGAPFSSSDTAAKHALHGYFNSLRHEKLNKGLAITLFCPGPTFSGLFQKVFTGKEREIYRVYPELTDIRLAPFRCSRLYAVALANKLKTSWAAPFPMSLVIFFGIYYPKLLTRVTQLISWEKLLAFHELNEKVTDDKLHK